MENKEQNPSKEEVKKRKLLTSKRELKPGQIVIEEENK